MPTFSLSEAQQPEKKTFSLEDAQQPAGSFLDKLKQAGDSASEAYTWLRRNAVGGAIRGAGSIGSTILTGADYANNAINDLSPTLARALRIPDKVDMGTDKNVSSLLPGAKPVSRDAQRRIDMDEALKSILGADPKSLPYQGFKLGGEIAGTAGAGSLVANGARAVGASAPLVNAIATGGFGGGGGMATRMLGGAINGGATAGLADPENAGAGALIGSLLPGAAKLAGSAGNAISEASDWAAKKLMQSALKPTIAQLRTGDAQKAIDTLLQYGINPTKGGVDKMRGMVDDLNTQIAGDISNSGATIDKSKVMTALDSVKTKFGNQVSPTGDLAAIQKVADDFTAHPNFPGMTLPVQDAQALKQGTYRVLGGKYGQLGSAETEAQKGLARGLKDEIATAVPSVGPLNAQESELINALKVSERRALMDLNKNPLGLAALTHNPMAFAAFMADKSALFKSIVARGINTGGGAMAGTGGLLGNGLINPAARTAGLLSVGNAPLLQQ